jgi:hypothetical protein
VEARRPAINGGSVGRFPKGRGGGGARGWRRRLDGEWRRRSGAGKREGRRRREGMAGGGAGKKGGRGGRRKKKPLTCGPHTSAGERGRGREERERRRSGPRGPKADGPRVGLDW